MASAATRVFPVFNVNHRDTAQRPSHMEEWPEVPSIRCRSALRIQASYARERRLRGSAGSPAASDGYFPVETPFPSLANDLFKRIVQGTARCQRSQNAHDLARRLLKPIDFEAPMIETVETFFTAEIRRNFRQQGPQFRQQLLDTAQESSLGLVTVFIGCHHLPAL